MTQQQSETVKSEVTAAIEGDTSPFVRMLEEPMWQAIFASVTTISLFGFVVSGIWLMDAIVN
ncbi:MAG: hypothetical protein V2I66_09380 [Halieaceae bacterium]|jgi:hypothetical protein|nr:hypothetical protein [Halieaceae bacterium]